MNVMENEHSGLNWESWFGIAILVIDAVLLIIAALYYQTPFSNMSAPIPLVTPANDETIRILIWVTMVLSIVGLFIYLIVIGVRKLRHDWHDLVIFFALNFYCCLNHVRPNLF